MGSVKLGLRIKNIHIAVKHVSKMYSSIFLSQIGSSHVTFNPFTHVFIYITIPKTLIRFITEYIIERNSFGSSSFFFIYFINYFVVFYFLNLLNVFVKRHLFLYLILFLFLHILFQTNRAVLLLFVFDICYQSIYQFFQRSK